MLCLNSGILCFGGEIHIYLKSLFCKICLSHAMERAVDWLAAVARSDLLQCQPWSLDRHTDGSEYFGSHIFLATP